MSVALQFLRNISQNFSLYAKGFAGLMISMPLIVKAAYTWGQLNVLKRVKEIEEKNKRD